MKYKTDINAGAVNKMAIAPNYAAPSTIRKYARQAREEAKTTSQFKTAGFTKPPHSNRSAKWRKTRLSNAAAMVMGRNY